MRGVKRPLSEEEELAFMEQFHVTERELQLMEHMYRRELRFKIVIAVLAVIILIAGAAIWWLTKAL